MVGGRGADELRIGKAVAVKRNLNGRMSDLVDELVSCGLPLSQGVREFERQYIVATLRHNEGNLTRSAKLLGIHRNTLRNKVGSLGIRQNEIQDRPKKTGRSRSRG